jgi:hypothetical protein
MKPLENDPNPFVRHITAHLLREWEMMPDGDSQHINILASTLWDDEPRNGPITQVRESFLEPQPLRAPLCPVTRLREWVESSGIGVFFGVFYEDDAGDDYCSVVLRKPQ